MSSRVVVICPPGLAQLKKRPAGRPRKDPPPEKVAIRRRKLLRNAALPALGLLKGVGGRGLDDEIKGVLLSPECAWWEATAEGYRWPDMPGLGEFDRKANFAIFRRLPASRRAAWIRRATLEAREARRDAGGPRE